MTKVELRNLVIAETGRTDKADLIDIYLGLGLTEIGKRHVFREMVGEAKVNVTAGAASTDFGGFFQIFGVRLIDGLNSGSISVRTKRWVTDRWPFIAAFARARPMVGYIEEKKFFFCPIPDRTYEVRATIARLPVFNPELGGGAPCPIPLVESALAAWTRAKIFGSIELYDRAAFALAEFERELGAAILADGRSHEELGPGSEPEHPQPWDDPFEKG